MVLYWYCNIILPRDLFANRILLPHTYSTCRRFQPCRVVTPSPFIISLNRHNVHQKSNEGYIVWSIYVPSYANGYHGRSQDGQIHMDSQIPLRPGQGSLFEPRLQPRAYHAIGERSVSRASNQSKCWWPMSLRQICLHFTSMGFLCKASHMLMEPRI